MQQSMSLFSQTISGLDEFISGQREAEAAYTELQPAEQLEMAMAMAGE